MSSSMTAANFFANYQARAGAPPRSHVRQPSSDRCAQGLPFLESLRSNKLLLRGLVAFEILLLALVLDVIPELTAAMELVSLPSDEVH
jgi:hypothetical protein